ncbi:Lpg1974 family pore-forming outer membrane protein [Legionella jordanis]|uniref:Outer membrane protein n=1 Tax=Legionella jordanis TaxID=456 RepID=A0A0W0VAF3_9GAMM|nr:Lpg1974 family pore-forming outer membrane protein [Legionella jordanis]KTD17055.1 outer membrane protein [Legionella jordanis]RMX03190.1 hypothetical protein EAW55_07100 [Legionella jordanis]RMX18671.1 hypothetical protein EAS68_07595 [Legionella jordanis]VEH12748.1 major outer membrane protein [Legionella jordanis]
MYKRLLWISLSLSSFALYALPPMKDEPVCISDSLTVPCPNPQWDVGISALYLKPYSPLLQPYVFYPREYKAIKSEQDWGFLLEGSYHFNTGNDININWLHFDTDYSDSRFRVFEDVDIPTTFRRTDLVFDNHFNAVNVEFAQTSSIGRHSDFRYFAGLQYVYADVLRTVHDYERTGDPGPLFEFRGTTLDSSYQGVGPRLGIDMTRKLPASFSLFAKGAAALLVGKGKAKLSGELLSSLQTQFLTTANQRYRMVPELEASLGASYDFNLFNGQMSLMAGWLVQHYIDIFMLVPGETINTENKLSSHPYTLSGPFIKGKWLANA